MTNGFGCFFCCTAEDVTIIKRALNQHQKMKERAAWVLVALDRTDSRAVRRMWDELKNITKHAERKSTV